MERPSVPQSESARERWSEPESGRWYDAERWSHAGRRRRDPDLVREVLARTLARKDALVLDAPSGTGRLRDAIEASGRYVGAEISDAMLAAARATNATGLARADVRELPFRSGSFDAVVCCRLLHHLRTVDELDAVLAELVRVSRGLVLGSFWDAGSIEALRHRLPFVRRPRHRVAHPKARIEACVARAGARVFEWKHSLRFLSQQTWFVARVEEPE